MGRQQRHHTQNRDARGASCFRTYVPYYCTAGRIRQDRSGRRRSTDRPSLGVLGCNVPNYERRSILLTTNLAFKDWGTIFPNAACATALIDRLTHRAEIITLTGESYRRREAEAAQKARRVKA